MKQNVEEKGANEMEKKDMLQIELNVLLEECESNIKRNEKYPDSDYSRGQIQSDKFVVSQLKRILADNF